MSAILGRSLALTATTVLALAMVAPTAAMAEEDDTATPGQCQVTSVEENGETQATTLASVEQDITVNNDSRDDDSWDQKADRDWRDGRRGDHRPITVWMAGDSTMADPSAGAVCPVGWGNQFDAQFRDNVTVVNKAMGGRSIQTWLYESAVTSTLDSTSGECVLSSTTPSARWQTMLDTTSGMKPGDYLFIQFGINDGSRTCPRHVGSARYEELMSMMVQVALERHVHPVVLTPVAAITCSGSTATGNRGYLTETANVAAANHIPMIDLHTRSIALYNSLGLCPNDGNYSTGAVGDFFCNDHTHFEAAGAAQIAALVARSLREQHIRLGRYVITEHPHPADPSTPADPTPSASSSAAA